MRMSDCTLSLVIGALVAAGVAHAERPPPDEPLAADGCPLEKGPIQAVSRVIDADTLALDDGTEVRLIGALAARPAFSARAWRIETAAIAAVTELVAGRSVTLGFAGRRTNRYGQKLAHVFVERGGERIWVQGDMLRQGFARAYGLPGSFGCMSELVARERTAREARAGLWADRAFQVLEADPAPDLKRWQSTFQLVRGEVRKVERVKDRLYVNFGTDWRDDFTVGATLGEGTLTAEWAKKIEAITGETVEVRGWIERRYGPFMEIWDASQIEAKPATAAGRPD